MKGRPKPGSVITRFKNHDDFFMSIYYPDGNDDDRLELAMVIWCGEGVIPEAPHLGTHQRLLMTLGCDGDVRTGSDRGTQAFSHTGASH